MTFSDRLQTFLGTGYYYFSGIQTYLYLLVVDERGSFSAIDAHIFPCLVQTVLEDVD